MNSEEKLLKMLRQVDPANGRAGLEAYLQRPAFGGDFRTSVLQAELAMEGMSEIYSPMGARSSTHVRRS